MFAERDNKVRNHDHVTGKYRGFAHGDCIISFKWTKKIPIMFHNLRGYGSHFVMQEIGKIGVELELISGIGMYLLVEKGMRGVYGGVNKLVPNLGKEGRYVLHYRNLQLCLSLGIKLTGVHRILKFKQSYWLKKYIDFSTDKRKNTVNSFENDLFKLINNCL